jgi:hypothetical protein
VGPRWRWTSSHLVGETELNGSKREATEQVTPTGATAVHYSNTTHHDAIYTPTKTA